MPKGYLVANVEVTDPDRYGEYRKQVGPMLERFGGRFLVRGGTLLPKENAHGVSRVVVIEFASLEDARRFYESPEYQPLLEMRTGATRSTLVLVEGV